MEKYYRDVECDINLIETILISDINLGKTRTNKLISILNKKKSKRYNMKNKERDLKKSLRKYNVRGGVTCKKK